jgi:hypothetical protein
LIQELLRNVSSKSNDANNAFATDSNPTLAWLFVRAELRRRIFVRLVSIHSNPRFHKRVTNGQHLSTRRGDAAFEQQQHTGSGRPITGACMARVNIGKGLLFVGAIVVLSTPANVWASADAPLPAATSFAYSVSHPVTPLPASVIDRVVNTDGHDSDDADAFDVPHETRVDVRIGAPRALSRTAMCNAVVSVARANDLPIPFFANLIWQESNFDTQSISRAGALGVAQYMPQTANEQGLINPFEPIHALHVAGKFLRRLQAQFGNLGLAAAAYNAGPRRVTDWVAKRGALPGETRNYVVRITGRQAEQWTSGEFARGPEAALMPAKAPCVQVAEAVEAQGKVVRVARLMSELAAVTAPPPRDNPAADKFDEAAWKVATAKPDWQAHALDIARGAVKNIRAQEARAAFARSTDKPATRSANKTERAWKRIAERTLKKAAEEFAGGPPEKKPAAVHGRISSRRTHVASTR